MSNIEYQILRYLYRESEPVLLSKILNDFFILANPSETDSVLKSMLSSGLLLTTPPAGDPQLSYVSLSDSAVLKLIQEEDHREKELQASKEVANENSKKERQQRFDNNIAIASLLVPFVTFILGIILEHFAGIISLFIKFFS